MAAMSEDHKMKLSEVHTGKISALMAKRIVNADIPCPNCGQMAPRVISFNLVKYCKKCEKSINFYGDNTLLIKRQSEEAARKLEGIEACTSTNRYLHKDIRCNKELGHIGRHRGFYSGNCQTHWEGKMDKVE